MVQAILEGRKSQTRRIIKSRHESGLFQIGKTMDGSITKITSLDCDERPKNDCCNDIKSIANVGDILWVRETWQDLQCFDYNMKGFAYKADNAASIHAEEYKIKWKPSIFMPKEAARIFLKITNIRVERLQDISVDDAISEGIEKLPVWKNRVVENLYTNYMKDGRGPQTPRLSFFSLWESINGKESLASNPWVWVYDFTKVEKPSNFI